ncbi:MAG: hypothetical protein DHS20C04_26290 [Hyphococcus sp.]|nr:MAG: hypothetical protein DHS20C04_26290 [Marinicaulis sp.]
MNDVCETDPLLKIKSHLDSHGVGCAIIGDHIAIGLWQAKPSPGCPREKITRVRSLVDACDAIGCDCDRLE